MSFWIFYCYQFKQLHFIQRTLKLFKFHSHYLHIFFVRSSQLKSYFDFLHFICNLSILIYIFYMQKYTDFFVATPEAREVDYACCCTCDKLKQNSGLICAPHTFTQFWPNFKSWFCIKFIVFVRVWDVVVVVVIVVVIVNVYCLWHRYNAIDSFRFILFSCKLSTFRFVVKNIL